MTNQPPQDAVLDALARRLAMGDRSAFEPLYRALWPILLRHTRRAVRDPNLAEDAAQEALLKIYGRIGQWDATRGSLRRWALTVASYECMTVNQRVVRRRDRAPLDEARTVGAGADAGGGGDRSGRLERAPRRHPRAPHDAARSHRPSLVGASQQRATGNAPETHLTSPRTLANHVESR